MRYGCRGELARYEQDFRAALQDDGYAERVVGGQLRVLADLDSWLEANGLALAQMDAARVEDYLAFRRGQGHRLYRSTRGLAPLLTFLRGRSALPPAGNGVDSRPFATTLAAFRRYLLEERRLRTATAEDYEHYAALFLSGLPGQVAADLSLLDAGRVVAVVRSLCRSRGRSWVKNFTTGLRSLLRFLFLNGDLPGDLSRSVLPATSWRRRALPRALDDDELRALVACCSCRDAAIVALAVRLGLRSAEVAALTLSDVDWRAGEVVVHGKGGHLDRLPLPADVGEAVVAYLKERPPTSSRSVFITSVAPRRQIAPSTVEGVVQRAGRRAGLGPVGPHRLRHTAATRLLRAGASLSEIGQVLRHEHTATTAIYARVDLAALTPLAMPWPEVSA